MPSPVGHAIAGVAAAWLVAGAPALTPATFWREAALFGALGALPDIDLLVGAHSGPTHSLGAAVVVGMAAGLWAGRWRGHRRPGLHRLTFAVACLAAYASHLLLDWLGRDSSPPIGIMALWPVSRDYFESTLHVFLPISRRYYQGWTFVVSNVHAVCLELVILVPILAVVTLLRPRRVAPEHA
jgi:membrane-bound metal-dependent hydrolase YbcI (DUF457 family)